MTKPSSDPKGDVFLYYLERGQHWFEENWKKLAIVIILVIGGASIYAVQQSSNDGQQKSWWDAAGKLKTVDEKAAFIKNNGDAEATKILYLTLAKEELEKGLFQKAKDHMSQFIKKYPEDINLPTAFLLRGYAQEEMGNLKEAKADYKKSSTYKGSTAVMAKDAYERLEKKKT